MRFFVYIQKEKENSLSEKFYNSMHSRKSQWRGSERKTGTLLGWQVDEEEWSLCESYG